ncbi:MAG: hypothetical protein PHQ42_00860 [Patescibacteria group bacterium]|nr:hypothetical protein [Patescibacteria group bacterium]
MPKKRILVIGGPTGVGETTVTNEIIKSYPIFKRLVTATTRKKRLNEKNGRDYYFFSNKKFNEGIKKGNIIEYQNTRNKNVYYGTYKPDLEKKITAGYNIIVNPDIVGTKFYKKNYNATAIFIIPKSLPELKKRLFARDPLIPKKELEERFKYAKYEMKNEAHFYDYKVMNEQNKLRRAVNQIIKIIKKEGYRLKK